MFNEHGGFRLTLQGNIMFAHITGPWNAETANAFKGAINKEIEPLKGQSWAIICDIYEWELCTPDCELLIVDFMVKCRELGLKRSAIVSSAHSVKLDLFKKNRDAERTQKVTDGFRREFFTSEALAKSWLDKEGFELT